LKPSAPALYEDGDTKSLGAGPRFPPVADQHLARSPSMILEAAEGARGRGEAVVLGAGDLAELPLAGLCDRFECVRLVDADPARVEAALAHASLTYPQQARLRVEVQDVVGLRALWEKALGPMLAGPVDTNRLFRQLVDLARRSEPAPPAVSRPADLVVASTLLSQLHKPALDFLNASLAALDPALPGKLQAAPGWMTALAELAGRLEAGWLASLGAMVNRAPPGRIYLAATPALRRVRGETDGRWSAGEGLSLLSRGDLAAYAVPGLGRVDHQQWYWVGQSPGKSGELGYLYTVEAMILKPV